VISEVVLVVGNAAEARFLFLRLQRDVKERKLVLKFLRVDLFDLFLA
jgi:hypothetical protein